jgi:hypothetical protein
MRTLSRWMICGAALVGAAVPAGAAEVAQTHAHAHRAGFLGPYPPFITGIATRVLEPGSGLGAGAYRLPAVGDGSATLQLFDDDGRVHYVVTATLVRSPEPDGEAARGGILGTLYVFDLEGRLVPAAQVAGKWVREVDGTGSFGADLLVPASESRDHRLVAVGSIAGALRSGIPSRGASGTDGLRARTAVGARRLSASWIVRP